MLKTVAEDDRLFKDEDFNATKTAGKKEKGMFLKDQIRDHALKKMKKKDDDGSSSSSESSSDGDEQEGIDVRDRRAKKESTLFEKIGVPYTEQEFKDKQDFKEKAFAADEEGSEDEFLVQKKKKDVDSESEESTGEEKTKKKKQIKDDKPQEMKLVTDTELLSRFYGKDSELDEGEKFLRNYILHEGWK